MLGGPGRGSGKLDFLWLQDELVGVSLVLLFQWVLCHESSGDGYIHVSFLEQPPSVHIPRAVIGWKF